MVVYTTIIILSFKFENIIVRFINSINNIIKISIIIPVFNKELYLQDCLNSVINQSIKEIEIICINDGSTDKSQEILELNANKSKNIIIINQKNQGSAISRNIGIKKSRGKFIAFLDSDDLYPNNFVLELLYNKAIQNKAIICGGGIRSIKKNNATDFKDLLFKYEGFVNFYNYQYDLYYQRFIYNTKFLRYKNLLFPNYLRYQDPPFFIKTMALAKRFYTVKNITYIFKVSSLINDTMKINEKSTKDIYKGLKESLDICEKYHLYQLYCNLAIRVNSDWFLDMVKNYINNDETLNIISQILTNLNKKILKKKNVSITINDYYLKLNKLFDDLNYQ